MVEQTQRPSRGEEAAPGAERDRHDDELVFVDESRFAELRDERPAPEHRDPGAVARLERADRMDQLAVEEPRMAPRRSDRVRGDVLRRGVHPLRDLGHLLGRERRRPERRHHLVRDPTEEEVAPGAGVAADPVSELAIVPPRVRPTDVVVYVGEVAVDGDRLEHSELPHDVTLFSKN